MPQGREGINQTWDISLKNILWNKPHYILSDSFKTPFPTVNVPPGIKSPKRTYFLGISCSWPHTAATPASQTGSVSTTCSPWGAAETPQQFVKLVWQQLSTAPQNINPSEVHTARLVNLFQKRQQLPEARDTKEGEVGSLQGRPKEDPGGGREKGMPWGHRGRFTLGRRCSMLEEAPLSVFILK